MGNQLICHHCYTRRSSTPQDTKRIKVLLVGLDNAGKTTAAKGLVGETVTEPAPTLGFCRLEVRRRGWWVDLYDVGGGRGIRGIWHNYLAECHGLVFVVDASAPERTDECRAALHALVRDGRVQGKPILLLANKQDVPTALDEVELNERLQLETVANQYRCPMRIHLCIARPNGQTGRHKHKHLTVHAGFNWLTDYVIDNHATLSVRVKADLAERADELEEQRRAREERVRQSREAATTHTAAQDSVSPDPPAAPAAGHSTPPGPDAAPASLSDQPVPVAATATGTGCCPRSSTPPPTTPPSPPATPPSPLPLPLPPPANPPLNSDLDAQIEEVFTRTEMGRLMRERAAAADGAGDDSNAQSAGGELLPEAPALEKDSGQGSTKESDSETLASSDASQLSSRPAGADGPKRRNRFFKRYTKTAPMPDDANVASVTSTPTRHQ